VFTKLKSVLFSTCVHQAKTRAKAEDHASVFLFAVTRTRFSTTLIYTTYLSVPRHDSCRALTSPNENVLRRRDHPQLFTPFCQSSKSLMVSSSTSPPVDRKIAENVSFQPSRFSVPAPLSPSQTAPIGFGRNPRSQF
jgi:hypothetical protein